MIPKEFTDQGNWMKVVTWGEHFLQGFDSLNLALVKLRTEQIASWFLLLIAQMERSIGLFECFLAIIKQSIKAVNKGCFNSPFFTMIYKGGYLHQEMNIHWFPLTSFTWSRRRRGEERGRGEVLVLGVGQGVDVRN